MPRCTRTNSIVRLPYFPLPTYARPLYWRVSFHLLIIWLYDFRGMVVYPDSPCSLVSFSFPRWLNCRFFGNFYLYDSSPYTDNGNMLLWVDNSDLQIVSIRFCKNSARQTARRRARHCVRHRVRQNPNRLTLRVNPIFRHVSLM